MARLRKFLLASVFSVIILVSLFLAIENFPSEQQISKPSFFVGVEIGWLASVDQAKEVVDKVKNYTNLLIIATPSLTAQETTLNETCDYAYNAGMYLMVYFSMQMFPDNYNLTDSSQMATNTLRPFMWEMGAKQKYGDHFLGVYFNDEPGGQVLDSVIVQNVTNPSSFPEQAEAFVQSNKNKMYIYSYLRDRGVGAPIFTSDYGLYWFDYEAGFDVVMAQFGWNNSRLAQIGLTRGAAALHRKDWGVMVTWTYNETPYLETGSQLYRDLVLAYDSGAKYAAVYDSSSKYQRTTLADDHFAALKDFWNYVEQNPEKHGSLKASVGLILPHDYGFGFRSTTDTFWGLKNDRNAQKAYEDLQAILANYGSKLDILYEDTRFNKTVTQLYGKTIDWVAS